MTGIESKMKYARKRMEEVLQNSAENNLKLQKPRRLRVGNTMTRAQRYDYIQVNKSGILIWNKRLKN